MSGLVGPVAEVQRRPLDLAGLRRRRQPEELQPQQRGEHEVGAVETVVDHLDGSLEILPVLGRGLPEQAPREKRQRNRVPGGRRLAADAGLGDIG